MHGLPPLTGGATSHQLAHAIHRLAREIESGGAGGGIPEAPVNGQLYGRQDAAWVVVTGTGGSIAWDDITGKPTNFPPTTHNHPISQVTNLQATLDGKAALVHTHTATEISDFSEALDARVADLLVAGANITLTYDDVLNALTIASTASGGGGIPEAPTDGQLYARRGSDTSWQVSPAGADGPPGPPGPAGARGEEWFTGAGTPPNSLGLIGDWYLDSVTGDYWEKTGA